MDGNRIAESIRQRAKAQGFDVLEAMRRYTMERLVVRLRQADEDGRIMLKGGLIWWLTESLRGHARPTVDIDIHLHEPEEHAAVQDLLAAAGAVALDDGCRFEFHSPKRLEHTGEHEGLRVKVRAWIGTKYVDFHVDVGFGGRRPDGIEPTEFDSMHPKISGGSMLMTPIEYVAAEKLHAIVKHGMNNTRLKDYNDLMVISELDIDQNKLAEAVAITFEDRATPLPEFTPDGLSAAYAEHRAEDWSGWLISSRRSGKVPSDFGEVVSAVAGFAETAFTKARNLSEPRHPMIK